MTGIMSYFTERLLILPGIVIGLTVHEFGHAFVSHKCGDPTPKQQGRLSLNPLAHIDWVGFISLLLLGFGWGKPVQIDPRYYKHRRMDEVMVAFAGVFMNLITAFAGAFILSYLYYYNGGELLFTLQGGSILMKMLIGLIQINLVLIFFNLIPLPPLDGFGIVTQIFKLDRKPWYFKLYQMGPMLLLILILTRATSYIITPPVNWLYSFLINLFL